MKTQRRKEMGREEWKRERGLKPQIGNSGREGMRRGNENEEEERLIM